MTRIETETEELARTLLLVTWLGTTYIAPMDCYVVLKKFGVPCCVMRTNIRGAEYFGRLPWLYLWKVTGWVVDTQYLERLDREVIV